MVEVEDEPLGYEGEISEIVKVSLTCMLRCIVGSGLGVMVA